ncbi:MAG: flagellar type III secretion system pore protein FliP [Deltaproteobacteria bacterium]|nr:flagellar type III secretion system pore protein FliP [Deltaproteobacteria bacterium]
MTYKIITIIFFSFAISSQCLAVSEKDSLFTDTGKGNEQLVKPADEKAGDIEIGGASPIMPIARVIGATLIVVPLIVLFIYALRFLLKDRVSGGGKVINVLTTGSLGPKKTIAVVDVAGEVLVLGITPSQITFLSKIEDEETLDKIRSSAPQMPAFFDAIAKKIGSGGKGIFKKLVLGFIFLGIFTSTAIAQEVVNPLTLPAMSLQIGGSADTMSTTIQILLLMTVLTLAPAILIMMTSFTRLIIVFSFLRQALGTQQVPPNQILIGLALFMTLFIMSPVLNQINETALKPYLANEIKQDDAFNKGIQPLRSFMLKQVREKDLALFIELSKSPRPKTPADIPTQVLIPAFIISELKTAFQIGFLIYIPFLVIDMVVSSVLMSMGMMMLPPVMVSLPFKLLIFVMVDGWYLIVGSLVKSFH